MATEPEGEDGASGVRILRAAGAPAFTFHHSTITALASPSRGSRELFVFASRVLPGQAPAPHAHDSDELVLVTAGRLHVRVAGVEDVLEPGDVAVVEAGSAHTVWVEEADGQAELLVLGRAGHQYLDERGEPLPRPAWAQ